VTGHQRRTCMSIRRALVLSCGCEQPRQFPSGRMVRLWDPEQELAAAIAGRQHWPSDGRAVVFAPPGAAATAPVLAVVGLTRRGRFVAVISRGDRAEQKPSMRHAAAEAVRL